MDGRGVVICPFLFAALARGDRLGVSASNGNKLFWAELAPLFKDAVSISREKGAVAG
jgi:hypothetical protein